MCGKIRERARRSRILPMVFRLDIGLKFANPILANQVFFSRGEISASLNFEGKVAWVKDRFARCEMRIEKVSAHDFRNDVGM